MSLVCYDGNSDMLLAVQMTMTMGMAAASTMAGAVATMGMSTATTTTMVGPLQLLLLLPLVEALQLLLQPPQAEHIHSQKCFCGLCSSY